MARHVILQEGHEWGFNGNEILPGALKWDQDGKYPLLGPGRSEMIGHASDLRREDDGSVTAELHFSNEKLQKQIDSLADGWGWTIYARNVAEAPDSKLGSRIIESCKLVYVFLAPFLPWGKKASQEKQGS